MTASFRSVITGGPGAGKSTLLAAIGQSGIVTFPEVARSILQSPAGMEMRANRPADFAIAMLEAEFSAWRAAPKGPSLYDRGFPDIAGFLQLAGLAVPKALDRVCRDHRYTGPVFRAPPWQEIYSPDEARIQSWDEAVESDVAVCAAWTQYGYQLVDLPLSPISDRRKFIMEHFPANLD